MKIRTIPTRYRLIGVLGVLLICLAVAFMVTSSLQPTAQIQPNAFSVRLTTTTAYYYRGKFDDKSPRTENGCTYGPRCQPGLPQPTVGPPPSLSPTTYLPPPNQPTLTTSSTTPTIPPDPHDPCEIVPNSESCKKTHNTSEA